MRRTSLSISLSLGLSLLVLLPAIARPAHANGIVVTDGDLTADARGARATPVRLTAHRVTATIDGPLADVTVEQVFHSDADRQLEGTYLFPLPPGAAVSKLSMTMAGKMVEGEVVEAKEARHLYEDIVRKRRDPGLLEYVGTGLFKARVFPIEPRQDLTIRIAYQQVLPDDGGTLEFRYPLSTDRLNARPVDDVRIDVSIASAVDLKAIYSPSHAIEVKRDGERRAKVSCASAHRRQDRDFVLYVGRSAEDIGCTFLSTKAVGEKGTFMAVLAPRNVVTAADRVPRDVTYVLDISGSMAGPKMDQAREAVSYGIRLLAESDRFNVIAFSTDVSRFQEQPVTATSETREAAVAWVKGLQAGGGTNIEMALSEALRPRAAGRLPMVVFLTDGLPTVGVTDSNSLVQQVAKANTSGARVFTFGVGFDLDVKLLDRIAEVTHATRDYVAPGENIEVVTGRFFRKVNEPVLSDVVADFGPGVEDVYPKRMPDLFAGEQVVVFGRYRDAGKRTIRLTGQIGERKVERAYDVEGKAAVGAEFLPRLWAHRKVAYLLDQIRLHGANKELVDEVTSLGLKFAIVTPYTSGLVLEPGEARARRLAGGAAPAPVGADGVHPTDLVAKEPVIKDAETGDHIETDQDMPFEESLGESGLSDAPFEGPANNGLIGIGGGAGGSFSGRGGHRNLRTGGGGGKTTDDAVEEALKWLMAHQSADGGWEAAGFSKWCDGRPSSGAPLDGAGIADHDVAVTGASLLAFLGAGYTNRGEHPFARVVQSGLRYLKSVQDPEGCFGPRLGSTYAYDHATGTLAMVEAFGMTGSAIYKGPAQKALDFLAAHRDAFFATDAGGAGAPWPLPATSRAILALYSAGRINAAESNAGRLPLLLIDPLTLAAAKDWVARADQAVDANGGGESEPIAAAAFLGHLLLGDDPRRTDAMRKAVEACSRQLPVWDASNAALDLSRWHDAALVLFQAGGDAWRKWNDAMKPAVVDSQRVDSDYCGYKGSWDPIGGGTSVLGRVHSTATLALCLEVYYRYDRATSLAGSQIGVRPGAPPAAAAPMTEADRARASLELKQRMEASSAPSGTEDGGGAIRTVAGKTFRRAADDRWIDSEWDGKTEPTEVVAWSDAYLALLAEDEAVAQILSLGERLVLVRGGKVIEVTPAAK